MTVPMWVVVAVCLAVGFVVSKLFKPEKPKGPSTAVMDRITKLEEDLARAEKAARLLSRDLAQEKLKAPQVSEQMLKLWVDYQTLELKYTDLNVAYTKLRASKSEATTSSQFSQEDIKRLIRLCHPDKHNNSDAAKAITQKLLEMRK